MTRNTLNFFYNRKKNYREQIFSEKYMTWAFFMIENTYIEKKMYSVSFEQKVVY